MLMGTVLAMLSLLMLSNIVKQSKVSNARNPHVIERHYKVSCIANNMIGVSNMNKFKFKLDKSIQERNSAIDKNLIPEPLLNFINAELNFAILMNRANDNEKSERSLSIANLLIRYCTKPSYSEWDNTKALQAYLLTHQLP